MKKTSILTAVLLTLAFSLSARDFDVVSPSGHTLYCDVVQGGAAIVGMDYSPQNAEPIHLVIPSHVSNGSTNLSVVAIGDSAFIYCFWIFDVQIPASVKSIGLDGVVGVVGPASAAKHGAKSCVVRHGVEIPLVNDCEIVAPRALGVNHIPAHLWHQLVKMGNPAALRNTTRVY